MKKEACFETDSDGSLGERVRLIGGGEMLGSAQNDLPVDYCPRVRGHELHGAGLAGD